MTSTMGLYWRVIAYGSIVGIVLAIVALNLYYLTFSLEYSARSFGDAVRWGVIIALTTSGFVIASTVAVARKLGTRRGQALLVLLSFVGPVVGWLLFGAASGLLVGWTFFFGFPLIAGVAGITAVLIAAFATFFLPSADSHAAGPAATEDPLQFFDGD